MRRELYLWHQCTLGQSSVWLQGRLQCALCTQVAGQFGGAVTCHASSGCGSGASHVVRHFTLHSTFPSRALC